MTLILTLMKISKFIFFCNFFTLLNTFQGVFLKKSDNFFFLLSGSLAIIHPFNFDKGSVGLARSQSYNTEDSQFFIILKAEPLYETEYTPIGKVIYGLEALKKIKYSDKSQYVLRPDYINSLRMLVN